VYGVSDRSRRVQGDFYRDGEAAYDLTSNRGQKEPISQGQRGDCVSGDREKVRGNYVP
jgi:hypothetical protein